MILSEAPKSNNNTKLMHIKEFFGFSHSSSSKSLHSFQSTDRRKPPPSSYDSSKSAAMEEAIVNSEPIITKWDPDSSEFNRITFLFRHGRAESDEFVNSVNSLRRAMDFFISENSTSPVLVLAQQLMQAAMRRLEKEFYQILSENRQNLDPESISSRSSDRSTVDGETSDLITEFDRVSADLKSIADCMIDSGYGKECVKIYKVIRKSIVDETLYRLGTEKFKISRIMRWNWDSLEHVIKNWMNSIKIAVNTLFRGEKILCDHVFSRSEIIRESCFSEITKDGAIALFRFPELITKGKKDSDKIFLLMELYEANSDVLPEIEVIFDSVSTSAIKTQAQTSMEKLADSIRDILSEFGSTIQKDSSKNPAPGGGIHPLTRSAMNYISSLGDYAGTLSDILTAENSPIPSSYMETIGADDALSSPVAAQLGWLILVLLCKLDTKAELYKDVSLSYLFLANNLNFIVKTAATTNLNTLVGTEWVTNHRSKVKVYAAKYEATAWNRVVNSLPESWTEETAAEGLKRFNAAFEEAYRKQISWRVEDGNLRDELKTAIAKKVVPIYREFYEGCVEKVNVGVERNDLVKAFGVRFSPDDLGNYLSDLFHGVSLSSSQKG
ncbi:exocyst complex component EXO70H1-like [Cucurbita pepo subsp. pepo]|uniref:exocyst complex component EXO70H1-like n=1 Tax=Cucurbita pepo subsp. pepo TaxID=3664 RepID=UPI000C9D4354|nr:exocyst complex component EXO70H1-like [Cucurbita pepo subsp. pepo]